MGASEATCPFFSPADTWIESSQGLRLADIMEGQGNHVGKREAYLFSEFR